MNHYNFKFKYSAPYSNERDCVASQLISVSTSCVALPVISDECTCRTNLLSLPADSYYVLLNYGPVLVKRRVDLLIKNLWSTMVRIYSSRKK